MSSIKNVITQFSQNFFSKFSLSTPINILQEEFKVMCFKCVSLVATKLSTTSAGPTGPGLPLVLNVYLIKNSVFTTN